MPETTPSSRFESGRAARNYTLSDQVFCHSGYEYAERPTAFYWQGQRLEIAEILARWHKPGFKCFRVSTADGQVFELYYDQTADEWLIQQP